MSLELPELVSLFLLGFLGSSHCAGMCGPLVLALPGRLGALRFHLAYHSGRLLTYTLLGTLMGAARAGMASVPLVGEKVWPLTVLSILVALLLVFWGLVRLNVIAEPGWLSASNVLNAPPVRRLFTYVLQGKGMASMILTGALFGFLPCGLSWAAFSRALSASSALAGGAMTLSFGLGTLPVLLLLGTAFSSFMRRHDRVVSLLSALLLIGMGVSILLDALV